MSGADHLRIIELEAEIAALKLQIAARDVRDMKNADALAAVNAARQAKCTDMLKIVTAILRDHANLSARRIKCELRARGFDDLPDLRTVQRWAREARHTLGVSQETLSDCSHEKSNR